MIVAATEPTDILDTCTTPRTVDITPPIFPLGGQGWSVVIWNRSPQLVLVTIPTGSKWLPPFTGDIFGSGCENCSLNLEWGNLAWPNDPVTGENVAGFIYFNWSQEPSDIEGSYPCTMLAATHSCGA